MNDKRNVLKVLIGIAVFAAFFIAVGFMAGKLKYDKPVEEKIEIDTVRITDTIPHYYPNPVDGTLVKYVTKYLPVYNTDTVVKTNVITCQDTVAVQVPIESRHYHADEYDAYISGFEPNLDSIFVYQKTEYITKTITKMKPPDKWEFDLVGGVDYNITSKQWQPFAGGELTLNNHKRLKFGIEGGVRRNDETKNFEPYVGAKGKIRIF